MPLLLDMALLKVGDGRQMNKGGRRTLCAESTSHGEGGSGGEAASMRGVVDGVRRVQQHQPPEKSYFWL
jgi:hypothetical protein